MASQLRGILSTAFEDLVALLRCELSLRASRAEPLAGIEHLDRAQVVRHPSHVDNLTDGAVQLGCDEVQTAKADAVLGDPTLSPREQKEAEVGGRNFAHGCCVGKPTG